MTFVRCDVREMTLTPLSCRTVKNTMGARTLEIITESPSNFIYSQRKGKISIKPLKRKENGYPNQIQVRESIMQGESLSPLTFVVLNGKRLVSFVNANVSFHLFLLFIKV